MLVSGIRTRSVQFDDQPTVRTFDSVSPPCTTGMGARKRIAVIGAGCSGLAAVKCCLDEGLEPVCFEKFGDIGGLWNFTEDIIPGRTSVYHSATILTSKIMVAYSDFPVPDKYPPFLPHKYVLQYFRLYAKHFDLLPHIRLRCEVTRVQQADDFEDTGRWKVEYQSAGEDQPESDVFDGVMVCTGHHWCPKKSSFPGTEQFQGLKLYSCDYRRPDIFHNQKILIIGFGNSGADIAVDISHVDAEVLLSTRSGSWVLSRTTAGGYPADAVANTRFVFSFPKKLLNTFLEFLANAKFDHRKFGITPSHHALQAHPTVNDDLPNRILAGAIKIRPDVKMLTERGVVFADNTYEEVDAVLFCLGYEWKFPFLAEETHGLHQDDTHLYKYVFPPHLKHSTLAFIGLIQPIGSIMPISEMQSRWYTSCMNGACKLPSTDEMFQYVRQSKMMHLHDYVDSDRHAIETFYIPYMDDIAKEVGVKPNVARLLFSDPALALHCFFGPCVASQYRLTGPGQWSGARDVIIKSSQMMMTGLNRRQSSRSCMVTRSIKRQLTKATIKLSKSYKTSLLMRFALFLLIGIAVYIKLWAWRLILRQ